MSWINAYVGVPFKDQGRDFRGCDCWGLVRLVYKNVLDIDLPSYGEISASDLKEVSRNIAGNNDIEPWVEVERAREFDVAVMRFYGSKRIGHVGIVVSNSPVSIVHTEKGHDSVVVRSDDMRVRSRIVGFRRHRSLA